MGYCDEIGNECQEKCDCGACLGIETPRNGCECCIGDEAVYWQDEENNAFVDSHGKMLVTVHGHTIEYSVKCCPNCGRTF